VREEIAVAVNRQKVMARDMYACRYCHRCIQDTPGLVLQVDHYLAKSGLVRNSNDPDDYLTACALYYGCNQEKGKKDWNQPPSEAEHCIIVRARLMQPIAKALLDELLGRSTTAEGQMDLRNFIEALDKLVMEKQPKQVSQEPSGAVIPFRDSKYQRLQSEPCPGCGNRMSMVWVDKSDANFGHGECYACSKSWGFKFG
jgi:hypothetical protein